MPMRPRTKKKRQSKFKRCPKCQKLLRARVVRCRTCHQVQ